MHIVTVAWIFVVLLMAAAEASSTQGTLLGALFTLLLYGALPLSIVLYVMGTPARRRARLAAETRAAERSAGSAPDSDGGSHTPGVAVAPEREKP
ncbi:MAG: hypothetical protein EBY28_02480 [Betaproteobacteria bacterium]|nr:hypothetical protein [Betaproteobacteria bacterium]